MDLGKVRVRGGRMRLEVIARGLAAFALCVVAIHASALERRALDVPLREHADPAGN
jgi:hypothetical protein